MTAERLAYRVTLSAVVVGTGIVLMPFVILAKVFEGVLFVLGVQKTTLLSVWRQEQP